MLIAQIFRFHPRRRADSLAQHMLRAQCHWQGADLATLVEEELAACRTSEAPGSLRAGRKFRMQSIAVTLHQWATNAARLNATRLVDGTGYRSVRRWAIDHPGTNERWMGVAEMPQIGLA
jgi:hypothetical protein